MSTNTSSTFAGDTALAATVSAAPAASSAPVGSLDDLADYMVNGFWADLGASAHRYDTSSSNEITVDIDALSAEGKQLARWAFEAWEAVADIDFVEVSSDTAQIVMNEEGVGAFTGYQVYASPGDIIYQSTIEISQDWLDAYGTQLGSYAFQSYMHEIGHALGLGHTGNYTVTAVYGTDETYSNDSWQLSVMSYFDQQQNTTVDDTRAETGTLMMADIIAIQSIYGAADGSSLTAGSTIYGKNHTLGDSWLGELMDGIMGNGSSAFDGSATAFTIYDHSGFDIIDFSTDTEDQYVDLNAGSISSVFGLEGNMVIAMGTRIESYRSGAGDDTIIGDDYKNVVLGATGEDTLIGAGGNDALKGGGGNDYLTGDDGNDELTAGGGKDLVLGGTGRDVLRGGAGKDTMKGGSGNDILKGGGNEDDLTGGSGSDHFQFESSGGHDVVQDFDALDNNEVINLKKVTAIASYSDLMTDSNDFIAQVGDDVVITDNISFQVTLIDVDLADLDANDFIF